MGAGSFQKVGVLATQAVYREHLGLKQNAPNSTGEQAVRSVTITTCSLLFTLVFREFLSPAAVMAAGNFIQPCS